LAKEAAMIPFPSEEVTPPVTKTYLVSGISHFYLYYGIQRYKMQLEFIGYL
jgi:hypothetical protein